jgi:hypothetical protein
MQTLMRTFRTSNLGNRIARTGTVCKICFNEFLPGQIVFDKVQNRIRCNECDFEMLYGTKIYPGEKPSYTPYPPKDEPTDEPLK